MSEDTDIQGYYWFKPPGESDGRCEQANTRDSLPNSPAAGEWFEQHFIQLIENASPPLIVNLGN